MHTARRSTSRNSIGHYSGSSDRRQFHVEVVPAKAVDGVMLSTKIRNDALYLPEMSPEDVAKELITWISKSLFAYTGFVGDEIAFIYGIVADSILAERVYLWLITSELIDEYPLIFARHSQIELERILEKYPEIIGVVSPEYNRSVRWLSWLGASFTGVSTVHGKRVKTFKIRRD